MLACLLGGGLAQTSPKRMASEEGVDEGVTAVPAPERTWWNPLRALRALRRIGEQPDPEQPVRVVVHSNSLHLNLTTNVQQYVPPRNIYLLMVSGSLWRESSPHISTKR